MREKLTGKARMVYSKPKRINVGAGRDIREGWVNLDRHKTHGADVLFDLNNLFKGKKLPFKDESFSYVYCSHVVEDFYEPMVIIKELFRICEVGGLIEIRAPTEANLHLTNPYHKIPFSLFKFRAIVQNLQNYGEKYNVEIVEMNYTTGRKGTFFWDLFLGGVEFFYNIIPYQLVERTFIKYLIGYVDCRVLYRRVK